MVVETSHPGQLSELFIAGEGHSNPEVNRRGWWLKGFSERCFSGGPSSPECVWETNLDDGHLGRTPVGEVRPVLQGGCCAD